MIKFDKVQENIKPFMEYACMVCMAGLRMGNGAYKGCAMRNIQKAYCPWQERVYNKLMEENNKDDIFSNWLKIANVQLENEKTIKDWYFNLEGLK